MEREVSVPCLQEPPVHTQPSFKIRVNIILFTPSLLSNFPSGFLTKILYVFLVSPMRATYPVHEVFHEEFKLWSL